MKRTRTETKGLRASKVIARILKDSKGILHWLLLATLLSIGSAYLAMIAPKLLGHLTNQIYDLLDRQLPLDRALFLSRVLTLIGLYLASALLGALTKAVMNYSVSSFFTCKLRIRMSEKIARIPIKTVDSTPNGEFISRMTNDVSIMGGSIHDIFGVIINGVIQLIMICVIIFTEEPVMALTVIVFVPLSLILSAVLASRSEKHFNDSREQSGKLYSICEENLTCFDAVKIFSIEDAQNQKYREVTRRYADYSAKGYFVSGLVSPIVGLINNLSYVAICVIGAYLAIEGRVNVGALVAFIMYTKLFSGPLESIASGMSMIQSTVASARRVYEYLDGEEMEEQEPRGSADVRGEVELLDVCFSYVDDKPLIEHLDLHVKPGEKVAIVGPTGGGKTTIVNLLMRFYDAASGRMLVDGRDIAQMSRRDVREMFGMVLQDTVLFSGSVYENIAYGKEGATRAEVMEAARKAHIDDFIDALPNGYETEINEDSTNISAGQKQLLTIARAYLSDRPILILDEATSNVDTRTELLIQQTMDELMKGRTAFVIAHRLSTIENADTILVVDNGHIVEQGKHEELLRRNGLYARIYNSQYPTA
ncbi:MAG: ABC transporter ATP-binding protein [Clostridia bacterium]|nr:ABC transporter ATP-binding protein [Clostridia bacterium]